MQKACCVNCFSNEDISQFIESGSVVGNCDYCGGRNIYICDVDEVGRFIMKGIERYYEDAAMHVGYCSSEGGYLLPTQTVSEILLHGECIFETDDPRQLCEDLVQEDGTPYVRKDPYGPPSGEPEEVRDWEHFCESVKNRARFTLFMQPDEHGGFEARTPGSFLLRIAREFMPFLISKLPASTSIFRARIRKDRSFDHIDLTSPSPEKTRNNRMSPAGISYFYGAMDADTCAHEMRPDINEIIEIAEFEVLRDIPILDLSSNLEYRGSIFNPEYTFYEEEVYKPFLNHFVDDISKPVRKTDAEIEYVPTQVLTEFIKTMNFRNDFYYTDAGGAQGDVFLNGIMYRSSARKDGKNTVLFGGPGISTETPMQTEDSWLLFKGKSVRRVTEVIVKSSIISDEDQ